MPLRRLFIACVSQKAALVLMQLLQRDTAVRKSRIMSQHRREAEKCFRRQSPTWWLRAQRWEMNEWAALRCWRSGKSCLRPAPLSCCSGDSKCGLEPHLFVFLYSNHLPPAAFLCWVWRRCTSGLMTQCWKDICNSPPFSFWFGHLQ